MNKKGNINNFNIFFKKDIEANISKTIFLINTEVMVIGEKKKNNN